MTIRELAKIAGCSHTTVSKALKNDPKISKKVRDKVIRLAQAHGYQRDPLLSTLMGKLREKRELRTNEVIAYINWWDTEIGERGNVLGRDQERGMIARAAELGYKVEYFWGRQSGLSPQRLSKILYSRGIRGIVLSSLLNTAEFPSMDWERFSVATVANTTVSPQFHAAHYSKFHGMLIALHELRKLGYRRIGFTNLAFDEKFSEGQWLAAYLMDEYLTHEAFGIEPLVVQQWDKKVFADWVRQNKLDVILTNNLKPLEYLREMGMMPPQDIGFAILDLSPTKAPASGILQPRNLLGEKVIELVVEQLEMNSFGLPAVQKIVSIEGQWVKGETLRQQ